MLYLDDQAQVFLPFSEHYLFDVCVFNVHGLLTLFFALANMEIQFVHMLYRHITTALDT